MSLKKPFRVHHTYGFLGSHDTLEAALETLNSPFGIIMPQDYIIRHVVDGRRVGTYDHLGKRLS